MKVEEKAVRTFANSAMVGELNGLDESIMSVLSATQRHVERCKRNALFSTQKQIKESTVKYLRALINQIKGKYVDESGTK